MNSSKLQIQKYNFSFSKFRLLRLRLNGFSSNLLPAPPHHSSGILTVGFFYRFREKRAGRDKRDVVEVVANINDSFDFFFFYVVCFFNR